MGLGWFTHFGKKKDLGYLISCPTNRALYFEDKNANNQKGDSCTEQKNLQFEVYLRHILNSWMTGTRPTTVFILHHYWSPFWRLYSLVLLAVWEISLWPRDRVFPQVSVAWPTAPSSWLQQLRCSVIHEAGPDCERRQGTGILLEFDSSKPSNLLFLPCGFRRKRFFQY